MKKSNKTLLLSLGTVTMAMAPIATVIACGTDDAEVTLNSFSKGLKAADFSTLSKTVETGNVAVADVIDKITAKTGYSTLPSADKAKFTATNVTVGVDSATNTTLVITIMKALTGLATDTEIKVTGFAAPGAGDAVAPTVTFTTATMGTENVSLTEDTPGTAYSVTLVNASDVALTEIDAQFVAADETDTEAPTISWALTDASGDEVAALDTTTAMVVLTYTGTYTDMASNAGAPIVVTITTTAAGAPANTVAPTIAVTVELANATNDIMGAGPYTLATTTAEAPALVATEIVAAFVGTDAVTSATSAISSVWTKADSSVVLVGTVDLSAAEVWTVTITATDNVDSNLTVVTLTVTVS